MTLTLILLLVIIATAILVVKTKFKSKTNQISKIEDINLLEIDPVPVEVQKHFEPEVEIKQIVQTLDQPKKKRKYHKKKHPKKMDANKK